MSELVWPTVAFVALGVFVWAFAQWLKRNPPLPVVADDISLLSDRIKSLRDSTQQALQEARSTVEALDSKLVKLTREVRGSDLIRPKDDKPITPLVQGFAAPVPNR